VRSKLYLWPANMRSVGAAGSPYAAFRRAIEARNLTRAITEARDLPQISLADAAELIVLAADDHGPSFDRWAGRWVARYVLEEDNVTLGEAQVVLACLAGLRQEDREVAALALIAVFTARKRPDLERPFRRPAASKGHDG
jgi:hypothetical protein